MSLRTYLSDVLADVFSALKVPLSKVLLSKVLLLEGLP
jgi:hypothetical protein